MCSDSRLFPCSVDGIFVYHVWGKKSFIIKLVGFNLSLLHFKGHPFSDLHSHTIDFSELVKEELLILTIQRGAVSFNDLLEVFSLDLLKGLRLDDVVICLDVKLEEFSQILLLDVSLDVKALLHRTELHLFRHVKDFDYVHI